MTEEDAIEFSNVNPQIWEEFIVCASKLIKAGRKYYSARSIMHVLRWHSAVSGEGEYKVNHNMSPYYARKWAKLFPKYEEFFRIRKSQLDMEGETDVGEDLVGATTGDSDLVQSREVSGERIESGSYQSSFNFGG